MEAGDGDAESEYPMIGKRHCQADIVLVTVSRGCVIYSRLRRHRRFKPGPRQLKNARKQLVAVAECSSRLGAQKWETAISTRTTSSSDGGADQAGPRSGQWLRGAEDESNGGRFGVGAGGDEAAMASLEW